MSSSLRLPRAVSRTLSSKKEEEGKGWYTCLVQLIAMLAAEGGKKQQLLVVNTFFLFYFTSQQNQLRCFSALILFSKRDARVRQTLLVQMLSSEARVSEVVDYLSLSILIKYLYNFIMY